MEYVLFHTPNIYGEENVMICPLCKREMVDEEGLLWCDECGINEDSHTFKEMKREQEEYDREWNKE